VRVASDLLLEEYSALIDPDEARYYSQLARFERLIDYEAIGRKKAEHLTDQEDAFCNDQSEERTIYNYNTTLFVFDSSELEKGLDMKMGISDENIEVYIPDFEAFVQDYASIGESFLKR
jgi:hypothetical protein